MHPVRLRGHHLLCLLTYVGKGYTPAFVDNLDRIAHEIGRGAPVLLVAGPDDICAPMLNEPTAHCTHSNIIDRDRRAARDVGGVLGRPLAPGATVALMTRLTDLRRAFATGHSRSACGGCPLHDLCTNVARGGFRESRIGRAAAGHRISQATPDRP